jgi:hypothetical protein
MLIRGARSSIRRRRVRVRFVCPRTSTASTCHVCVGPAIGAAGVRTVSVVSPTGLPSIVTVYRTGPQRLNDGCQLSRGRAPRQQRCDV